MERAFENRTEAGRLLAEKLVNYAGRTDVIVLGLPRGGVPVAFEVARRLGALLDVFIVRKLGVPGFEELAAGAIASGGVRVLNEDVMRAIPHADEASTRSPQEKQLNWNGASRFIVKDVPHPNCAIALLFWWMTGWPPEQRCVPR